MDARMLKARWNALTEDNGFISYDVIFEGTFYTDPSKSTYDLSFSQTRFPYSQQ